MYCYNPVTEVTALLQRLQHYKLIHSIFDNVLKLTNRKMTVLGTFTLMHCLRGCSPTLTLKPLLLLLGPQWKI